MAAGCGCADMWAFVASEARQKLGTLLPDMVGSRDTPQFDVDITCACCGERLAEGVSGRMIHLKFFLEFISSSIVRMVWCVHSYTGHGKCCMSSSFDVHLLSAYFPPQPPSAWPGASIGAEGNRQQRPHHRRARVHVHAKNGPRRQGMSCSPSAFASPLMWRCL